MISAWCCAVFLNLKLKQHQALIINQAIHFKFPEKKQLIKKKHFVLSKLSFDILFDTTKKKQGVARAWKF